MSCGMYIVLVIGKLAKNATMDPVLCFGITTKNHRLYSCADVDMSTLAKKTMLAQAYKCIFRSEYGNLSKKRKSWNDQCHAHYQQTMFQNSDLSL